jgi:hypothetical protein
MGKVTVDEMRRHALGIAEHHDFLVRYCRRTSQAKAIREADEIVIAPIESDVSYATALHELGHILGRFQCGLSTMVRERWAWKWAQQNALNWTPRMERCRREALAWYAPRAKRYDANLRHRRRESATPPESLKGGAP